MNDEKNQKNDKKRINNVQNDSNRINRGTVPNVEQRCCVVTYRNFDKHRMIFRLVLVPKRTVKCGERNNYGALKNAARFANARNAKEYPMSKVYPCCSR